MPPTISIIIPHLRKKNNDLALKLNVEMLMDNTANSFELIVDTQAPKDPYEIWNETAKSARADILVFSNTDVLMAIDWDIYMVVYCKHNIIVTGYLVEPGNVGVADVNIHKDFGRHPDSFRRKEFEDWCDDQKVPECIEQRAWYMPCAVRKDWFLETGGFKPGYPFPNPNDIRFWDECRDVFGTKFLRVNSWAYHFQNLSAR